MSARNVVELALARQARGGLGQLVGPLARKMALGSGGSLRPRARGPEREVSAEEVRHAYDERLRETWQRVADRNEASRRRQLEQLAELEAKWARDGAE